MRTLMAALLRVAAKATKASEPSTPTNAPEVEEATKGRNTTTPGAPSQPPASAPLLLRLVLRKLLRSCRPHVRLRNVHVRYEHARCGSDVRVVNGDGVCMDVSSGADGSVAVGVVSGAGGGTDGGSLDSVNDGIGAGGAAGGHPNVGVSSAAAVDEMEPFVVGLTLREFSLSQHAASKVTGAPRLEIVLRSLGVYAAAGMALSMATSHPSSHPSSHSSSHPSSHRSRSAASPAAQWSDHKAGCSIPTSRGLLAQPLAPVISGLRPTDAAWPRAIGQMKSLLEVAIGPSAASPPPSAAAGMADAHSFILAPCDITGTVEVHVAAMLGLADDEACVLQAPRSAQQSTTQSAIQPLP